jgi:hypothetical protein
MSAESPSLGVPVTLPGEPTAPIEQLLQVDAPHNRPVKERLIADLKAIREAQRAASRIR